MGNNCQLQLYYYQISREQNLLYNYQDPLWSLWHREKYDFWTRVSGYGFSSSLVWMWELDYKESWMPENWCSWNSGMEKTLESPLECKEIKPVNPKGNQSWIFIWRTDAEAKTAILWPPDVTNWLIWTDPDAGKDWRQEEKGTAEDEMVGEHHWLDGHEFEQAPRVGDGQGSLACCSPWGRRVGHDWATELNWIDEV